MPWVFTVLLIAISAGIVGFAGWALRRLFTLRPGAPDVAAADVAVADVAVADVAGPAGSAAARSVVPVPPADSGGGADAGLRSEEAAR